MNKSLSLQLDELAAGDVLSVRLAKRLAREIIVGSIPANLHLTEDLVLAWTSASRSPVREAFRLLEQDGLVVREPRRGVRVTPFTLKDLDDVYRVRVALEGLAVECAAQCANGAQIAELDRLVATLSSRRVLADVEQYFDWNIAFSNALYSASGNSTLQRIVSGISKQALRYRFLVYEKVPGFRKESLAGARQIAQAIRGRDADKAREAQQQLVRSSWMQIRPFVEELEQSAPALSQDAA